MHVVLGTAWHLEVWVFLFFYVSMTIATHKVSWCGCLQSLVLVLLLNDKQVPPTHFPQGDEVVNSYFSNSQTILVTFNHTHVETFG